MTSIITAATSIIAIVISVRSLRATKRSIEDANRPYVVAYLAWMWLDDNLKEYLVIKNFGKTGATIKSIVRCTLAHPHYKYKCFGNMNGYFLAPDQKYTSLVEIDATGQGHARSRKVPITMTINYNWKDDTKRDTFEHTFSEKAYDNFTYMRRVTGFDGSIENSEKLFYKAADEFFRSRL
ncbi:hypothetical protein BGC39_14650 [Levilactobacillus brevis]|nr:hypothetical protein BGC39_14650 [Levilactobacillus brevis]